MKIKKVIAAGTVAVLSALMMSCTTMPVLAYSGEDKAVTSTTVKSVSSETVKATSETEQTEEPKTDGEMDVEWNISADEEEKERILTPKGNLTLVDDVSEKEGEALSYMTVKTKNGNTFYLIVDRSNDEENVYFLNMVDEADLMALMDQDTQNKFAEINANKGSENTETIPANKEETSNTDNEKAEEKENTKPQTNHAVPMLLTFLVIGGIGAGCYYKFKIVPEKKADEVDEDMEFEDDEDYVNEDDLEKETVSEEELPEIVEEDTNEGGNDNA